MKIKESPRFFIVYDKVFSSFGDSFVTEIGGVQRYLYELARVIADVGYKVCVVQSGVEVKVSRYNDVEIIVMPFELGKKNVIKNLQNKFGFQCERDVLIWGADTISVPVPNARTIAIQHGIGFDLITPDNKVKKFLVKFGMVGLYRLLQRLNSNRHFSNSKIKVCVDYNYLNWHRTYRDGKDNVYVIPNFCSYEVPVGYAERELDTVVVGFARRFVEKRGVNIFVNAARRILSARDDVHFRIAGDGPLASVVDSLARDFPGHVQVEKFEQSETFDFHKNLDIAVVPSLGSEGTSLSLLEAMGAGCGVIATNVGGMCNIVIDQFNGCLIPPEELALVEAITKMVEDREYRQNLGRNGMETVRTGFSYDLWRKKWLRVLSDASKL